MKENNSDTTPSEESSTQQVESIEESTFEELPQSETNKRKRSTAKKTKQKKKTNIRGKSKKKRVYNNKALRFRRKDLEGKKVHEIEIGSGKSKEVVPCVRATDCCYILFKDNKTCVFYTNDLAKDLPMMEDSLHYLHSPGEIVNEEIFKCLNGMACVFRWSNDNHVKKTAISVPAPIVAYNYFMNAVDIMDQYRGSAPTKRREKRLSTAMMGFILDAAVHNAYAIYNVCTNHNQCVDY